MPSTEKLLHLISFRFQKQTVPRTKSNVLLHVFHFSSTKRNKETDKHVAIISTNDHRWPFLCNALTIPSKLYVISPESKTQARRTPLQPNCQVRYRHIFNHFLNQAVKVLQRSSCPQWHYLSGRTGPNACIAAAGHATPASA